MKAQVLTVSIPYNGCDKSCPFCVSKMTGYINTNIELMERNIDKVKTVARMAQVSSVLFTGKGEPTKNFHYLCNLIHSFREFPTELQTNGLYIRRDLLTTLSVLQKEGLDVIAVSVNSLQEMLDNMDLFRVAQDFGLTTRCTVNLTNEAMEHSFIQYATACVAEQLSFRSITIPNGHIADPKTAKWINENVSRELREAWLFDSVKWLDSEGQLIRKLPYGARVYGFRNLSVTHFDYCIQDNHGEYDIRSLIFQEDGHLYTTWNSKASRLF